MDPRIRPFYFALHALAGNGDHGGHYASLAQKTSHNDLYCVSLGIK